MEHHVTSRVQIHAEREGLPGATFLLTVQGEPLPRQMNVATLQELALQAKFALEAHRYAESRIAAPREP